LLEDDAGVNESLALLFTHFDFDVVRHGSAESLFRATPPDADDIVFVDLKLPGVSGADAIRWLQSLKYPPRVVVISGQSQAIIRSELAGMGVAGVLRKPLGQEAVLQELRRIVFPDDVGRAPFGADPTFLNQRDGVFVLRQT
jgi:FixJ family two-component response regulator